MFNLKSSLKIPRYVLYINEYFDVELRDQIMPMNNGDGTPVYINLKDSHINDLDNLNMDEIVVMHEERFINMKNTDKRYLLTVAIEPSLRNKNYEGLMSLQYGIVSLERLRLAINQTFDRLRDKNDLTVEDCLNAKKLNKFLFR